MHHRSAHRRNDQYRDHIEDDVPRALVKPE